MKRRDVYENFFGAGALFITALVIMPALLFNPDTTQRVFQFLFFSFLVWLSGKKINFILTILIIAGITAFNLIVPYGRVLFSIGVFKITSGALTAGIHRAVTLEALVMLSKASVRQDLKLPGTFGGLLGESLRIFYVMTNKKHRIAGKTFFSDIDSLLLELSREEIPEVNVQITRTKPLGYAILAVVIVISWMFFLIGR